MRTNGSSTTPNIIEPELSYAIVGASYRVFRGLGCGLAEVHYKRALEIVLKDSGLRVEREYPLPLFFEGQQIGFHRLDLLVNRRVIVEVKSTEILSSAATSQLRNYLAIARLRLGILIHFSANVSHHRVLGPNALK